MKKLMIVAALAMLSIAANANAVKWSVMNVNSSDSKVDATTDYAGYLFITKDTSSTMTICTLDAITGALDSGDLTALSSAVSSAKATSVVSSTGRANFATTTVAGVDVGVPNTIEGFLVVMDADQSHYLVAQVSGSPIVSKYLGSGTGAYTLAFQTQAANTAWQVVGTPEPTSAMLMLLGFAGLALRRRRA